MPPNRDSRKRPEDEIDAYFFGKISPTMIRSDGYFEVDEPQMIGRLDRISFALPETIDANRPMRHVRHVFHSHDLDLDECPNCWGDMMDYRPVMVFQDYFVYPCLLCNQMVWIGNDHLMLKFD